MANTAIRFADGKAATGTEEGRTENHREEDRHKESVKEGSGEMTVEEITQTLQTVAANQARHDEMHARHSAHMAEMARMQATHSADIAEIDRMIAAIAESQNRYDKQLGHLFEVVSDMSDKQLKNEELFAENEKRFADLAVAQRQADFRMERLEGSYELLESFARNFREETHEHFAETDKRLATLAEAQARADERTNRTDEQIKALILAQTRTNEMVRSLVERNGSTSERRAKVKKAKKARKKGGETK